MNVRVIQLKTGQVEEVSEGYARNYLIPRKLAKIATQAEEAQVQARQKSKQKKDLAQTQDWANVAKRLPSLQIEVKAKASPSGTLYERIHASDILSALQAQHKITLDPTWLQLNPIKQIGVSQIRIKFPNSLNSQLHVNIQAK